MEETVHSSSVAIEGRGLLICGRSGAGKSSLALAMMALGAQLVADDQTRLWREGGTVWMQAPEAIRGMIEARGIGVLAAKSTRAELVAVLDLDIEEEDRLPPERLRNVLGVDFAVLHKSAGPYFPAALMQYLRTGRRE
ncbi:HPr kinase/phosphorylase [Sagittula marina]|nr:HPr kinase/phosphatase C-terminal domain-containing protein [Sagittula marina]